MIKRISISLEESVLQRIDLFAQELGINRSAAIAVMCDTVSTQRSLPSQMTNLMNSIIEVQEKEKKFTE